MQQPKGAAGGWMGALRASKKIRESQSNVPTREPSKSSVPTREQSTDDADQEGPMVFADHKEVSFFPSTLGCLAFLGLFWGASMFAWVTRRHACLVC